MYLAPELKPHERGVCPPFLVKKEHEGQELAIQIRLTFETLRYTLVP